MRLCTGFLIAIITLVMAGCGVRGGLEPPSAANAPAAEPGAAPTPAPADNRTFILDGLLL